MTTHAPITAELGAELAIAIALSSVVAGVVSRWPQPAFLAVVVVAAGLFLPSLGFAVLSGPIMGTASISVAVLPLLAWGWRRMPRGTWRTARALGGSGLTVFRVLVLPALAPFLLCALLIGGSLMAMRWRLDRPSHPAVIYVPDPVTGTG